MIAIISLLVILTFSILIIRIASIAPAHTDLSKQAARFQARSAFTGVGFTTNKSEKVVNHPVRRRILLIPKLVSEEGFSEWTEDGKLRHPRYLGLQRDKRSKNVVREG